MRYFTVGSLITMVLIVVQPPIFAGVVFEIESTDAQSGTSIGADSMLLSVEGKNLKTTISDSTSSRKKNWPDNPDDEMIYHADRREMVIIDHDNKEYTVMDEAFMNSIGESLGDMGKQRAEIGGMLQRAYESALSVLDAQELDPKARAGAEQMLRNTMGMGSAPSPHRTSSAAMLEISKGNSSRTRGRNTTDYTLSRGEEITAELKVATWDELDMDAQIQRTIESYFEFFAAMNDKFNANGPGEDGDSNFFEAMNKIGGFPVESKQFTDGELDEQWWLESITERDLDPDAFEPPKGYRLRSLENMFAR